MRSAVRRAAVGVTVFSLLAVASTVRADQPGGSSAPATLPETTEVSGKIPVDLVGRWLTVD